VDASDFLKNSGESSGWWSKLESEVASDSWLSLSAGGGDRDPMLLF
jgi:hypothetical protein